MVDMDFVTRKGQAKNSAARVGRGMEHAWNMIMRIA